MLSTAQSTNSMNLNVSILQFDNLQGFFRRTTHKSLSYRACVDGNCDINKDNRNKCQSCRMKKCIKVGMSRDCKLTLQQVFLLLKLVLDLKQKEIKFIKVKINNLF